MKRTYYLDKYNNKKIWEVTELSHGIYLRQYICGRKFGRGVRTNKAKLKDIGITEMCVMNLPNFDKNIFKELTESDVEGSLK